ncbi:MAG TPA: hypothetical protein VH092_14770 [Urbifossiella sp.]|nr:hypothetical protein [Urbifossiella sp.]
MASGSGEAARQPHTLRDGVGLVRRLLRSRWARGLPLGLFSTRWHWGLTEILHRLRARVDVRAITDEECAAAGLMA